MSNELLATYQSIREYTETICKPLKTEDYVVQPVVDVSPPKWHLGHTTWFFETFVLQPNCKTYKVFDPDYNYVFNSYYETVGARVIRTDRGNLSRPSVEDIYKYRKYVDNAMSNFLSDELPKEITDTIILGFNHEQQHQELLLSDIKFILGHNPLFPRYNDEGIEGVNINAGGDFIQMEEGIYEIGFKGTGFCFDNELNRHKIYLNQYQLATSLVSNKEYLEFIEAGGYLDFRFWHADGWQWVKDNGVQSPLYWHLVDGKWQVYNLDGLKPLDPEQPVTHVSYYEAAAYAQWKDMRLPTEGEWEAASDRFDWGRRWEWTESAYLPYPGFAKAPGAIGEYNGKFMINQMVLRGASVATSPGHSRNTYRNFFPTNLQWQYTGIRLAK
jgi:ergothioneine biosynthesis protein EgtB